MMLRVLFALLLLSGGLLALSAIDGRAQSERPAMVLDIKGGIGPATSDYVRRGIDEAAKSGAPLVILRIDTPGGLDSSMRDIVKSILASPVPIVGYVAPSGARAASAGTYILYATHIAAMAPGTDLGAVSLLLALYAFNVLPINYVGLALILLGTALMVAEAFVPSFGALGIGGIAAFVVGSIMLLDVDVPGFQVYMPLIGAIAAVSAILFLMVGMMAMKARKRAVLSGPEEMIGLGGEVVSWSGHAGRVHTHGEVWQARSTHKLEPGRKVRVRQRDGLVLVVEPDKK